VTATPATPGRPYTAFELLFNPDESTVGSVAIVPEDPNGNLGRALENLPAAAREAAVREVRAAAANLLNVNLIDMLIAGWLKYHELTSAARRTLTAPGSSELVSMVHHRVTAAWQPYIKVLVDGRPVATIQLGISVIFDVSALLAGIRAGLLAAVHTGRCDITATLAIDGMDVLTQQKRLELPGAIPVTPGIRLLPAEDYPAHADQPSAAHPLMDRAEQAQTAVPGSGRLAADQESQPPGQGGRWWEAAAAATPTATTAPCPPVPQARQALPPAATHEKPRQSTRWWGR
jgi:hypothetical protein